MSPNRLVEIPRSDWHKLRDLYVEHKDRSAAYSTIQNFINWVLQDPLIVDLEIYSLNGDWESDGTFLIEWTRFIVCNTLNENHDRLIAALDCLDKAPNYTFLAITESVLPAVFKHMEHIGLCERDYHYDATAWYHISRENVEQFTIDPPMGIRLASLNENHVDIVNNIWPHKHPGSEKFVEQLIRLNPSIGAFTENGTLIAWCLRLPYGALGLLQVVEEHKRKGLGQLMVRAMAKKISALGDEVMAPVVLENVASRSMFEKLGFIVIDQVYWLTKVSNI